MSTSQERTTSLSSPSPHVISQEDSPDFKVYRPPQESDNTASRDVPESFFTPSPADLKAAQESLSARTQALTNAPLRTQAMREAEHKARMTKYPITTIRVRFPDRTQLEKTFPSTDKIRSIYAFVRGALREDVKPIKFVLYQTPPRRELKVSDPKVRDLSLFDLQLSPASVLHLKFESDDLNHVDVPAPLDPIILARAVDLPLPPIQAEPTDTKSSEGKTPSTSTAKSSSGKTAVPRWLKLGPNK